MIVGIDPGRTGAICFLDDAPRIVPMPDDVHKFLDVASRFPQNATIVMERQWGGGGGDESTRRKKGSAGAFSYGKHYGEMLGVLATLGISPHLVAPITWLSKLGLRGTGKDGHWHAARQAFPQAKIFKYAADAVLLAVYGQRFLRG